MKQANTNCLFGLACPNCGRLEPLLIEVTALLTVFDDGGCDTNMHEWDRNSACVCGSCGYNATVATFETDEGGAP